MTSSVELDSLAHLSEDLHSHRPGLRRTLSPSSSSTSLRKMSAKARGKQRDLGHSPSSNSLLGNRSTRRRYGTQSANGSVNGSMLEPDTESDWRAEEEQALLQSDQTAAQPNGFASVSSPPKQSKPRRESGQARTVAFGASDKVKVRFPANLIRNQKYNVVSFLPMILYEQFKFFFNLYFLLVALSQFVPALRIGFLSTYIVPLAFVLTITISKEAFDDWKRHERDLIANSARYNVLDSLAALPLHPSDALKHSASAHAPMRSVPSSRLRVGDLVVIEKDQRVPADCVLLRTSDESGSCFVRTDQLDGETDWKLRVAVRATQALTSDAELLKLDGEIYADAPSKDIHNFTGTFTLNSKPSSALTEDIPSDLETSSLPLNAENVLWANTVLAAGQAIGFIVYTGQETRAVMNTSNPETKTGLLDLEINKLAKILCIVTFALSVSLVALNSFRGQWYTYVFRFVILFSSIIPISLRVNLDLGKTVYARQIMSDAEIPGTIVRTSTLPEELGRIEYLLTDKTGTLTQNEMEMKKLHMGTISYTVDTMDEVSAQLDTAFEGTEDTQQSLLSGPGMASRGRRDMSSRLRDIVLGLALCHNVTPVIEEDGSVTYQASSPDEVAIVRWTESVGLVLSNRTRTSITLRRPDGSLLEYDVLELFPFTSESKRMAIIIRDRKTEELTFYQKGADVVMSRIVQANDWLDEECGNMAREGLRTLVVARKRLGSDLWDQFQSQHHAASISTDDREAAMASVVSRLLERDMELLGLTGVEDKLQTDVRMTLELLRNAGLKIWMLTGDKIETATCIAISSKLVSRGQYIHQVSKLRTSSAARDQLDLLRSKRDCCLVIDGESLQLCMELYLDEFIELATSLPCVVACRCSPTQKADVARIIRQYTRRRVCCIGDGGNDVSMIQAADVGVGIVGKEGKQASLAADFSITQFSFLTKLLVWHGRNSYKRSAKLAQFVIHRGLIVSVITAVFCSVFYFAPIAIFQNWLMVGYATVWTMAPVFSLVLDRDVDEGLALLYPELYQELTKGRSLSYKTFFVWLMISVYQGGAIMIMSLILFEDEFINIVAISFTALILNELIMVALEVSTWHLYMWLSEIVTLVLYVISILFLPEYFNIAFVFSVRFAIKVAMITAVSTLPLWLIKSLQNRISPASYAKLRG
ncbi:uncharacterized protein L969DRAFT_84487 [Mixia osmundae IAM 14324]|uniref:Phospholipid-transporting ATPase n=1 Tax=Mixia osmundae (strain CBS 9802 / IAM 14324 / JCM 22182 / KY 12970) TaxID=764103 RepID=G7DZA9_MIXOS|nr:uncharacterized protein L969DRAFT_84487 [Mixia osmundae IAM 14324]KEI42615.1 hypothetical protein L969DRAFT_84487 [Mixia osmundae IAM 14324]GAA95919.1 hypothetical protein E5Q_02577 [Mixia osmundae IAM 14324]